MSMERNNGPDYEPEQYSFLEEKIKNDTLSKKQVLFRSFKTAGRGLIFGIAASIGFFALKPWAETTFRRNPDEITIPKDDEVDTPKKENETTVPDQQMLTMENYKELNHIFGQVVSEIEKSVVEVAGIQGGQTPVIGNYVAKASVSGVIIADNGQELLVLVNDSVVNDAQSIKVRFVDGAVHEAMLKKKDGNIGMAVLSVSKKKIKETTWSRIKVAELGSSNALNPGTTLIGVGNLFSQGKGVGYGTVSSISDTFSFADGEYSFLVTDMPGTVRSSGVLFDIEGKVMGMVHPRLYNGECGVLTALGISSIKSEIELMSNAKDVPYLGMICANITEEISKAQNIPRGLYVMEVEADSPAMKAGIQAGDIIIDIEGKKVESLLEYHSTVLTQKVGEVLTLKGQRRGAENYVEIGFTVTVGIKE